MVRVPSVALLLLVLASGCGASGLVMREKPARPFGAIVIPGCPVEADGALSRCLLSRVLWGAVLWERGYAERFIVSGGAVYSPWAEADAMAAGLAALGVPADRIQLEPHALHTDENMYNAAQIARALGIDEVAVASNGGHALWGCRMMLDWGQRCRALPVDLDAVKARHARAGDALAHLSIPKSEWKPLAVREEERARATGRPRRPSSGLLYLALGLMKTNGEKWIPFAPARPTLMTWAERR